MASLNHTALRRIVVAGLAAIAAFVGATLLPSPSTANEPAAKIGLIDLTLNPETLSRFSGVTIKHLSFWTTGYTKASKQSREHTQDHGEVMARALIEAYQAMAPGAALELYVASPFIENAEGKKLLDVEQLAFAFDWFASQGVKVVALTFVGRNTPTLASALDHAAALGLIVLGSAGNGPSHNPVPAYPAAYANVIAIGTTGLNGDRSAEDHVLHDAAIKSGGHFSSRGSYVDYGVTVPALTQMQLRRDRELSALQGSSRATVVAAGLLVAVTLESALHTADDAMTALDGLVSPCDPEIAARGVLDVQALQSTVKARRTLKPQRRDRDAA